MREDASVRYATRTVGIIFCVMTPLALLAQVSRSPLGVQTVTVRGEIRQSNDPVQGPFIVELRGFSGIVQSDRTSGGDGSFSFNNVTPGAYRLVVSDRVGRVLATQVVVAEANTRLIFVDLPPSRPETPASGSISARRLAHQVPGKARKEFEKSEAEIGHGREDRALGHLQKAVEIDPEYFEAHVNLGVRWMNRQEFDKAVACFQTAVGLDADSPVANGNLAAALLSAGQLEAGERAARRAVGADPSSPKARYLLGLALAQLNRSPEEAIDNLRKSVDQISAARLPLARLLYALGDPDAARQELEAYLSTGEQSGRQLAQTWLRELDAQAKRASRN